MAVTTPVRFSATIQDPAGIKANTQAHVFADPTQTITQINTALAAWLAALNAVTGGKIIRAGASVVGDVSSYAAGHPVAGTEIQETASFDFTQAGVSYHYGNVVPGFLESLEVSNKPDLTNAAVIAYFTLLATGTPLGGYYSGPGNNQLLALAYAFLPNRKHRRAQRAVSYVTP